MNLRLFSSAAAAIFDYWNQYHTYLRKSDCIACERQVEGGYMVGPDTDYIAIEFILTQ